MARVIGLERVVAELRRRAADAKKDGNVSVAVGYTAAYALAVHENIEMKLRGEPRASGKGRYWDPQGRGQAKFLEQPAREHQDTLARIVVDALRKGATLAKSLLLAGLRLQRESQQLVPVDTGNLKASAFTRLE